jgi:hemolysin III
MKRVDAAPIKPSLRGVVHQWSFFAAVAGTAYLLVLADTGREAAAAAIYGATLCGLLGTSALYHRVTWQERSRRMMRRLDHSMIFLLIAGTYTPFALVVLSEPLATIVLVIVWAGALAGVVITFAWIDAPKPLVAAVCLALGWVALATLPQLVDRAGWAAVALIGAGGVLYSAGAATYAFKRPNPWPAVFGYHEVFHVLVTAAAVCHYVAVAAYAIG